MKRARNDFFESENTAEDKVFSKNTEKQRKPEKVKKEKPAKAKGGKKKVVLIVVICVVVVLILAALGFFYMTKKAEERRQQEYVDQVLSVEVFHKGVVVDGMDITGLTVEEAKQMILAAHAEEDSAQYTVLKNAAYEQTKAAVEQRAAEEEAKQEAAAQAAAQAAAAAPEGDAEEDAAGEVILDENGMPIEVLPEEEVPEESVAPLYTEDANGNFLLNKECVTFSYNIDEVLAEAFGLAKSGTYEELFAEVEDIRTNGREYTTVRTLNVSGTKAAIQQIADQKNIAPIDAKLEFNTNYVPEKNDAGEIVNEDAKFAYIDEIAGISIDVEATYAALEALAQQGTVGEVEMVTAEVLPTTTVETLKGTIVLRGSFTTKFNGSLGYKERVHNITKAAGMVNGKVVQPGETFSMNDTIGVRNKANGWQMAGALSGGKSDVKQYGGGVCQVSTTMYNAVVKADLEIVYRQAHSEKSAYVDGGLDATINSVGNPIDFKWKNNTDAPIMVVAYVNGYTITVDIYGAPFNTTEYDEIRLSSKLLSTIDPPGEREYKLVTGKPADYSKEIIKRKSGSKWQSFKNYYKDGVLVKSEKLATSTYRAYAGLTEVGALPTSPTPTVPGGTTPTPPAGGGTDPGTGGTDPGTGGTDPGTGGTDPGTGGTDPGTGGTDPGAGGTDPAPGT